VRETAARGAVASLVVLPLLEYGGSPRLKRRVEAGALGDIGEKASIGRVPEALQIGLAVRKARRRRAEIRLAIGGTRDARIRMLQVLR
jgi:hypothetical protein